jgi:hypothetical protein
MYNNHIYSINEFVEYHKSKYTYYCEIVILKDGSIQYAIPSHQYKLMEIAGVPIEQIIVQDGEEYNDLLITIPTYASPTHWLSDYTNTAVVWYNTVLLPLNYTESQIETINTLIDNGILSDNITVGISKEYHHCDIEHNSPAKYITKLLDKLSEESNIKLNEALEKIKYKNISDGEYESGEFPIF